MSSSSDADAIIAVANAQRQTTPEQQPSSYDEDTDLWPEIRRIIETRMSSQPRDLQREIGPSELGTMCVHCLAAKLAGVAAVHRHVRARPLRTMVRREHRYCRGR